MSKPAAPTTAEPEAKPVRASEQPLPDGQWFFRLFGEGTYSEAELAIYLAKIAEGQIVGGAEGDDKARQVVQEDRHRGEPLPVRATLIREMIDGFTGDEDEQAILKILNDAPMPEREKLVADVGGYDALESEFHGEEADQLQIVLAGIARQRDAAVPLQWTLDHSLKLDARIPEKHGVLLRRFSILPDGMADPVALAGNKELTVPGAQVPMTDSPVGHPRNKGGQASASIQIGPIDANGLIVPQAGTEFPVDAAMYGPIDPLKSRVQARLDVEANAEEVATIEARKGTRDVTAKGHRTSVANMNGQENWVEDSRSGTTEISESRNWSLDYEQRLIAKREAEIMKSEAYSAGVEQNWEHQDRKDKGTSQSTTDGREDHGSQESVTITPEDLKVKLDAELKGDIEKKLGNHWTDIAKKIWPLTRFVPGPWGKMLRRLGPAGDLILEHFTPGADDLQVSFDLDGTMAISGTIRSEKLVKGWKTFESTTTGSHESSGSTDSVGGKVQHGARAGTAVTGKAGVAREDALRQGVGGEQAVKKSATAGRKTGSKAVQGQTVTNEDFTEHRKETFDEKATLSKQFVADIVGAKLQFRLL